MRKAIAGWAVYGRDLFAQPGDKGFNEVQWYTVLFSDGTLEAFSPTGEAQP